MRKIFPYLAFFCITTVFTSTSGFAVYAGACSNETNKSLNKECLIDDKNCQLNKVEQKDFENSL